MNAFRDVVNRAEQFASHHVEREPLSVRERMVIVLERIRADEFTSFTDFFDPAEGRMGVVVSFIAILELLKESLIEIVQSKPYAPIYVKAQADGSCLMNNDKTQAHTRSTVCRQRQTALGEPAVRSVSSAISISRARTIFARRSRI